jgi:hypothetical protein
MSKQNIIILSAIGVLVLIIGGVYFFSSSKSGTTGENGGGFFSNLFPGGGERNVTENGLTGTEPSGQEAKTFSQLTNFPIAGAIAASTTVRYVEKSTGHIYEISPQGKDRNRLSNTTILKIFETLWSSDANKMILRYFNEDTITNFSAKFSTSTTAIEGIFLPQETITTVVSPLEDKVFYLQPAENTTFGILTDFTNKKKDNIFSLPFSEFNIAWPSKEIISFTTKPSFSADGYLYFLNTKTKAFYKIIGGIKGLTALVSVKADRVLYSQSVNKGFSTFVFNIKDKSSGNLGLTTLPEKCVWSKINADVVYCAVPKAFPSADYPDEWYQGLVSFDDAIWAINIATGETQILYDETNADVINPFLTADEGYFLFTNKKDLTLWSLRLK